MARPKGIPMSEEQKDLRRKIFKGENNPFYGKKHSDETRNLMSKNHADFNGDNNPFKKSLNEENLERHKVRCKNLWSGRDADYRKKFGEKQRTGFMEISGSFWARLKSNAKQKQRIISFDISYIWDLFLKQNRKCALSGLEIKFSNKNNECTASLDRIDNLEGYVKGNVQWVHKVVNLMKRTLEEDDFINYCNKIAEYQNELRKTE